MSTVQFIAVANRKPNAAQAARIRRALKCIDPDLSLVIDGKHGAAPCWVQGPGWYGASHYRVKRDMAVAAFRVVMPPATP